MPTSQTPPTYKFSIPKTTCGSKSFARLNGYLPGLGSPIGIEYQRFYQRIDLLVDNFRDYSFPGSRAKCKEGENFEPKAWRRENWALSEWQVSKPRCLRVAVQILKVYSHPCLFFVKLRSD